MELQETIWRGIQLHLPASWELLLFSKQEMKGSITFADRYRYRLQVSWQKMNAEPYLKRMVDDYIQSVRSEKPEGLVRRSDSHDWRGVRHEAVSGSVSRHLRYFRSAELLLEVVEPLAEAPCEPLALESLLPGISPCAPADAGRWKAFGMDLRVGPDRELSRCEVHPGLARMEFTGDHGIIESFSRRGMLSTWLKGSPGEWLELSAGLTLKDCRKDVSSLYGHEIHSLRADYVKKPSGEWRSRPHRYAANAWICPKDGRLFQHEIHAPKRKRMAEEPAQGSLSCCHQISNTLSHV